MKASQKKPRKLVLRPETVVVLTPRRLAEIVGGSSGSCETQVSLAIVCGDHQGDEVN